MSIFISASPPYASVSNSLSDMPDFDSSSIHPSLRGPAGLGNAKGTPTEAAAALDQSISREEQRQGLYSVSYEGGQPRNDNEARSFEKTLSQEEDIWNPNIFNESFLDSSNQSVQISIEPQPLYAERATSQQQTHLHSTRGSNIVNNQGTWQPRIQQQPLPSSGPSTFDNGLQKLHPSFGHLQSRSQYSQSDPIVPRSGDTEPPLDSIAHLRSIAPLPDPDPRSQHQYQVQDEDDGLAWNATPPNMEWDDQSFDYDAFMADIMPNQNANQQQQAGPYFVDGTTQTKGDRAGLVNINPEMLNAHFQAPAADLPAIPRPNTSFHYTPRPTSGRPKGKARERATPSVSVSENPECIDCGKRYRTTSSPGRCNRCGAKHERRIASPFSYTLAPEVPTLVAAKRLIYPPIQGRFIQNDDFDQLQPVQRERWFLQQLLDAVNVVQAEENGADEWKARQQKTFNEKAKFEPGYTNDQVTARLRALFWEAVMFHNGGQESVYAVGGDNSGYSENLKFKFSERFRIICDVLQSNKRVVMDVIEGRGVQGFVSNPKKYDDRKASNNFCNVKKKKMMDKGKEVDGEDESVTAGPSRSAKRRRTTEEMQDPPNDMVPSTDGVEGGAANTGLRRSPRGRQDFSPPSESAMEGGKGRSYSPEAEGDQPPSEQTYGSGRSRTANWIHGGRGR